MLHFRLNHILYKLKIDLANTLPSDFFRPFSWHDIFPKLRSVTANGYPPGLLVFPRKRDARGDVTTSPEPFKVTAESKLVTKNPNISVLFITPVGIIELKVNIRAKMSHIVFHTRKRKARKSWLYSACAKL